MLAGFVATAVFLGGGWPAQLLEPAIGNFLAALLEITFVVLKVAFFIFAYYWLRATLPRFRYDQLMNFCWKILLPLGLINLAIAAILKMTIYTWL